MSDLIDRQAAIDALKEHRALFCDNTPDTFSKLSYAEKSRVDELDMAIATLINLPSAQQDCTECAEYDQTTKSCPKYCETIRKTVEEAQEPTFEQIKEYCHKRCMTIITNDLYYDLTTAYSTQPERKTGRWIHDGYAFKGGIDWMHCSECGHKDSWSAATRTPFCAWCGAKMEGES